MHRAAMLTLVGLALIACDSSGGRGAPGGEPPPPPPPPPPGDTPPLRIGSWTYFGGAQGLSADVQDVSADEGGNVYVAGGDAVYVKRRADERFLRFDAENAGLTVNCNDEAEQHLEVPTQPFRQCRIISVAGAAPGRAIIGFEGFRTDLAGTGTWDWVLLGNGGADVVAFDPEAGSLSRVRHVEIGSPPHTICVAGGHERRSTTCSDPNDYWWVTGRHLMHKINRIVVNHDPSTAMYGDAWMCGQHGTFSVLLNDAAARGFPDHTAGVHPKYRDSKDVWEHLHPAYAPPGYPDAFINGECTALSIDPRSGTPWGSNRFRTVAVDGYGPDLRNDQWWMYPPTEDTFLDLWPDPSMDEPFTAAYDDVSSMSHCADGTLWIGSLAHGLARIDPAGSIAHVPLPGGATGPGVSAVACDPLDASLWIGLAAGGVLRLRGGVFEPVGDPGMPGFAGHPVPSIQIDRWADRRIVYFAFQPTASGAGGVASYDGP